MNIRTLRLSFTALLLALGLAAQAQSETKLMTYNIKGHSMTDKRMGNIAKVIKYNMPDVVALQEVDNRNYLGGKKDYIGMLSKETGMHAQFHALVGTYYGIGILSKQKPLSVNFRTWERGEDSTASYEFKVTESGIALSNGVNINDESVTSDHLPVFVKLSYATGISQTATAATGITIASGSITNHGALKANVEVYTTSGQKTFACTLAPNAKQTLSLPKGMYIVRATNGKGVTNGKVLIN